MTTFITSDLHFGHKNILKYMPLSRLAGSSPEMDQLIIDTINDNVRQNDELWILGDVFFYHDQDECRHILGRINCKNIHLVLGNHDSIIKKYPSLAAMFKSVQDYKVLRYNKRKIVLSHFPIHSWDSKSHGSIHFHGHQHSHKMVMENRMDIGWDSILGGGIWKLDNAIAVVDSFNQSWFEKTIDKIIGFLLKLKSVDTHRN